MMGWFRLPSTPTGNGAFFSYGNTTGAYIELYTNSALQFKVFSSGSAAASFNLVTNRWYHMALVCRANGSGGMEGWLDGKLVVTGNPSNTVVAQIVIVSFKGIAALIIVVAAQS